MRTGIMGRSERGEGLCGNDGGGGKSQRARRVYWGRPNPTRDPARLAALCGSGRRNRKSIKRRQERAFLERGWKEARQKKEEENETASVVGHTISQKMSPFPSSPPLFFTSPLPLLPFHISVARRRRRGRRRRRRPLYPTFLGPVFPQSFFSLRFPLSAPAPLFPFSRCCGRQPFRLPPVEFSLLLLLRAKRKRQRQEVSSQSQEINKKVSSPFFFFRCPLYFFTYRRRKHEDQEAKKEKEKIRTCARSDFLWPAKKNFFLLPDSENLLCLYSIAYVAVDEQGGKHYYIT